MKNRISSGFLTGSLGEYLVYQKILQKDDKAKLYTGQKKADIILSKGAGVEIKTATYNEKEMVWGFGRIKPEKFDYLICVALDRDLYPNYYIFNKSEAEKLPTEAEARIYKRKRTRKGSENKGRYQSSGRTFHRFKPEKNDDRWPELVMINREISMYENRWEKITDPNNSRAPC